MKYMLVISYDGSCFHGFQRQNKVVSVQGYLERKLSKYLNEEILIKGSGRTDALVHAYNQVCHFETNKNVKNLKKELNKTLKDVHIKKIKRINDNFHARHSAKEKIYLYKIDLVGNKDPKYYAYYKNLDIKKMKEASKLFLGTHDFTNFSSGDKNSFVSTIKSIHIYKFNNVLYLKFRGVAFYRYMVRNLVGALITVGMGKTNQQVILDMLNKKEEKRLLTAKPNGLYLVKVKY